MSQKCSFSLSETIVAVALLLSVGALGLSGFLFYEYQKNSNIDVGSTPDQNFQVKVEKAIDVFVAKKEEEARKAQEDANKPKKVDFEASVDDDPVLGDPNAPVTIVEFSDYECPYCGRHAATVAPQLVKNYIETGKAKLVFRDFPLTSLHAQAMPAAVAANCAREVSKSDETYFAFHDKLFANQKNLNESAFTQYAADLGLDAKEFADCLAKNDTSEIENDINDGKKYGITGTPAFFINGSFIKGAYPYETFVQAIEGKL